MNLKNNNSIYFDIVKAIILLPIVLVVMALKPIILIRFGVIDSSRIGHLCCASGYIGLDNASKNDKRVVDILSYSNIISNKCLQKIINRYISPLPITGFSKRIIWAIKFWNKNDVHVVNFPVRDLRLVHDEKSKIRFSVSENKKGLELLEKLGVSENANWVCIHNRDSSYLKSVMPDYDWSYHDFRDFSVESMLLAAEELASRGYYVIRMGAVSKDTMASNNVRIIDYANCVERSEFADIYLLGNCHFYLGSDSGIFAVSTIFNRPFSFVNFPVPEPIGTNYYWNSTPFIFKHFYLENEKRRLSLREIFELGLANTSDSKCFESAGVELIENTSEEIRDLAIEVDERIKGEWQSSNGDDELQAAFWSIYNQYYPLKDKELFKAIIGSSFLRNNQYLLN